MDKIDKFLSRIDNKDKKQIKSVLTDLFSGNYQQLDLKKLKGRKDIFRARKGDFRIIYRLKDGRIYILAIEKRNEKTYKDF